MFFPGTPHLPTTGDRVVFRHQHQPYTVAMLSPDRQMVLLQDYPEPVRIEVLSWAPQPGDRVEVLFCPYLKWLQAAYDRFLSLSYSDPANKDQHRQTVDRIKKRMLKGINYRIGAIAQMDDSMVRVQFAASEEVMPITCVSVVERKPNAKISDRTDQAA